MTNIEITNSKHPDCIGNKNITYCFYLLFYYYFNSDMRSHHLLEGHSLRVCHYGSSPIVNAKPTNCSQNLIFAQKAVAELLKHRCRTAILPIALARF